MERITVVALPRPEIGKNAVKRVRKAGMVPAVLYGRNRTALPLAIERKTLLAALRTEAGRNVLIDLQVRHDGEETSDTVMIAEIQHDYLKREVMHVDLHQISLTEKVEAHVPVVLSGVPEGVTAGGILEQHLRELVVRCLPTTIPEHITADVQTLHLGGALHVRDLPPTEGIDLITPPDQVIAAVVAPKEEAAPAEAAAAAPAEPEVVGKEAAPAEGEAKPEPGARAEGKAGPAAGAAKPPGGGSSRAEKKES